MEYDLRRLKLICRIGSPVFFVLGLVFAAVTTLMVVVLVASLVDPGMISDFDPLNYDGELTDRVLAGTAVIFMAASACMTYTMWTMSMLMRDVSLEYTPFTDLNVRRLEYVATTFAVLFFVTLILYVLLPNLIENVVILLVACVISVLVFYCFAQVFRYGAVLQKESDEML